MRISHSCWHSSRARPPPALRVPQRGGRLWRVRPLRGASRRGGPSARLVGGGAHRRHLVGVLPPRRGVLALVLILRVVFMLVLVLVRALILVLVLYYAMHNPQRGVPLEYK